MTDKNTTPQHDAPAAHQRLRVGPPDVDERADAFLAQRLNLSRQEVRRLLGQGNVTIDGRGIGPRGGGVKLREGEVVEVASFLRPADIRIIPRPDLPLTVLASGEGWLVVDKPAGMPVHPLEGAEADTVLNAVAGRYPQVQGVGEGGLRSGVVHRLDVDTSGTLAVAIAQGAWEELRAAFAAHNTEKVYRALVVGRMTGAAREEVDLVVGRHKPALVRVVPPGTDGSRRCDLEWRAVETLTGATLVEVSLGTGFLHQVRVTLAHLGHPILGDATYGGIGPLATAAGAGRLMLHASELSVGPAHAHSPDPSDFAACLTILRRG